MDVYRYLSVPVTTISPYTVAHPEYRALLSQRGLDLRFSYSEEYVEVFLSSGNGVIWRSGTFRSSDLKSLDLSIRHYIRAGERLRTYLTYTRFRGAESRTVSHRVPGSSITTVSQSGRSNIRVNGNERRYHDVVQRARVDVARRLRNPPAAGRSAFPRSTSLRPNPESCVTSFTEVFETWTDSGPISTVITPRSKVIYYREWTGSRTPNFGRLKPRQLPVNPHTAKVQVISNNINYYRSYRNDGTAGSLNIRLWYDDLPQPDEYGYITIPVARNKALRKLIEKAELGIEANLAQDFVQFSQITELLSGTAEKLVRAVNHLRRGNIPGAIGALGAGRSARRGGIRTGRPSAHKNLAENWLELQYGWKPLLMDIEGLLKNLSNLHFGDANVRSVTAKGRYEVQKFVSFKTYTSPTIGNNKGQHMVRATTDVKFSCRFKVESPLTSFLAQTGFTNPINLVWEVLPFSFVADWFIPIGPYLSAMSAWDGCAFLDGSETLFTKHWMNSAVNYEGVNVGNPAGQIIQHAQFKKEITELTRLRLSSFPIMSVPSLQNPLSSVTHALNGIALLVANFHR